MTIATTSEVFPQLRSDPSHGSTATADSSRVLGSTSTGRTSARSLSNKRASGSQVQQLLRSSSAQNHRSSPSCSPTIAVPFSAARATAASLRKQRSIFKPAEDVKVRRKWK